MYQFLWIFFVYAFLGWCTEVAYAALVTGKFVNRGFLNGPVCPIYGFGVVIVAGCLTPLKDNTPVLFAGSVLLTSLLELTAGFVLEKLFHQRWWDYSDQPFNLWGYVCLRFSLAWGIACLIVVDIIHPSVLALIRLIPHTLGLALLCGMGGVMAVDLAATVKSIARLNDRLRQIDELAAKIREGSDELGESLAGRVLELSEKGEELKESLTEKSGELRERREELKASLAERSEEWKREQAESLEQLRRRLDALRAGRDRGERRLMRAFPDMSSRRYQDSQERWKRWLEEHKGK